MAVFFHLSMISLFTNICHVKQREKVICNELACLFVNKLPRLDFCFRLPVLMIFMLYMIFTSFFIQVKS